MDEWGFPIAGQQNMAVDDFGNPIMMQPMVDDFGNPMMNQPAVDEWGFPIDNSYSADGSMLNDEAEFLRQQQMIEQNMLNQQAMMLQQESQYAQQNLIYSAQAAEQKLMNAMMKGKQVHYTNHEIVDGLRNYVTTFSGGAVPRELIKLEDFPQTLRHACAYTKEKITYLPLYYFDIQEIGTRVPFYYCKACRRLYYPRDIINGYY